MSSVTLPRIVSVVIGTRNRPDTLRAALASIRALEGPDLTFEILVGDNGSTPETEGVVAEFGGIYDKTDVYGCPAARNLAMKRITGEFVAFLDDDDAWLPENIRPHIALLDAHPEFEAAFAQVVFADDKLRPYAEQWPVTPPADNDFFVKMMSGYYPQVGATVVRARAAKKYGLMDETLIGDSDWDWQLRIARDYKIGFVDQPVVLFRGRPPGSSDRLIDKRVGYTRRIFFRHFWSNLSRWNSPAAMATSYFGTMKNYFWYFINAAQLYAGQGKRGATLKAFWTASTIFPTQFLREVIKNPASRAALKSALLPSPMRVATPPSDQKSRSI